MTALSFDGWTSHGWGLEVRSSDQLFAVISRIALLQQSRTYAWRGQADASWTLSSSLYRKMARDESTVTEDAMRDQEVKIVKEARRWGLGRDLGSSATDMHMLAVLQHHGVPTRLIDVTSNPMTALWFAVEEHEPDANGLVRRSPGVLFAIDVTKSPWYQTFDHEAGLTWGGAGDPLGATYASALGGSAEQGGQMFRAFPALPDERMKAQEGYFIGSSVPPVHHAPGVLGFNPIGTAPGAEKLDKLKRTTQRGRPASVPFCAIVIPAALKDKVRDPLKHTYNRRRRVLFPDVDGFREGYKRNQLD